MIIPARVSGIRSSDFKYTFCKKMALCFSDSHRTHYGELIQYNKATRHKYLRGGPWWFVLARHSTKCFTLTQSFLLWSLNLSSYPCKASKSVPKGPALPESFCATDSTTYSVIYTGIKTGVASYTSNAIPSFFFLVHIFH